MPKLKDVAPVLMLEGECHELYFPDLRKNPEIKVKDPFASFGEAQVTKTESTESSSKQVE